jgi:hypothetical protein
VQLSSARRVVHSQSPKWHFQDATFERSAAAFDNPDHVSIVIHNYRWRLGLADGEPQYNALEERLAAGPVITVPTIGAPVTWSDMASPQKSSAGR